MIPQGAKCIVNKFAHKCYANDGVVQAGDGAAILDVNITGKWETFHLTCLPAPYEAEDVKPAGPGHPYHSKYAGQPGKARCATCSHWQADHTFGQACTGAFRGAPACTCTAFSTPAGSTPVPPTVPPTPAPVPTTVGGYAAVAQATQPGNRAGWRGSIPMNDDDFRLVVFFGPIHSASDGDSHFISANTVLELHRMPMLARAQTPVEFVGPDDKRMYRPRKGDFIIGPRYTPEEYEEAAQALADRLVQEGITA